MPAAIVYTPEEAAQVLRVSRAYLFQLLADKQLASLKLGRKRLIPAEAIDALVKAKLAAGAA